MRVIKPAVLFATFALLSVAPACAESLGFSDDVGKAESVPKKEKPQDENGAGGSDSESPVARLVWELFKLVWAYDNAGASYSAYPYEGGTFVYPPIVTADPDAGFGLEPRTDKSGWYTAETQAFYLDGVGYGTWASFRGHLFRFFGPTFEGIIADDDPGNEPPLYGARLGGLFSLFQSNPLSVDAYLQWQGWSGMLRRSGATLGLEIQSFPVKPLAIRFRAAISDFESFQIGEYELKAGFLTGRWEFFGGWRWWHLLDGNGDEINVYQGPLAGAAIWF